ncbi:N-acetyltransferase [Agromyces protaetiae]|uniref:N-acetyltransferase n=1 Tax=Agromyces protaetiae TaxID=2509455 RepID=A0A4P6F9I9_9MICO|nr:GNAT family protein [Agromyces protaetiae]QAY72830.1 N-acetyltransferase [Agromyces protaetiae]
MPATRPAADELVGRHVRLSPLDPADSPELYAAIAHPDVFASGFGGGPAGLPRDLAVFEAFAASQFVPGPRALPWTIRLASGPDAGTVVGTTTLGDLDLANEGAHIGWTAYDPRVWATAVNPEAKLLLLDLAFSHGFSRVKLQADSQNARSRAAIEKLGATFEGVLRHHRRRADLSWRDTAVYSILVEEWPGVRAGLEARLAAWDDRAVVLGAPSVE